MQGAGRFARISPSFNARATFALRRVLISPARTPPRPRYRGLSMRTAITLLEWSIGAAFTIAVVAYMADGARLMASMAL